MSATIKRKHAFIVYASANDPGRLFHAMTYALQAKRRDEGSQLYFAGEATAWPALLADSRHPMHALFDEISQHGIVQGACENCAIAFSQTESARPVCGLVRGGDASSGQIDVLGMEDDGWRVWLF